MFRVALIFLLSSFCLHAEEFILMKGEAFDKKEKLVYIETRDFKRAANGDIIESHSKYHDPNGKLIVEVSSNFSKNNFIPDTLFFDHRFNEKQELNFDPVKKEVAMKITHLQSGHTKVKTIKHAENMVSAQGLPNYIHKNYDLKESTIKFIVLSRLDSYSFNFEREKEYVEGQSRFALRVSNWVLRAILKEIVVIYRDRDHALMSYNGITNIESDSRDSQILNIKMSYPGEHK